MSNNIWAVRDAFRKDWPEIQKFYKDLDEHSRYMYFGGYIDDEVIDTLWKKFEDRNSDKFFVVEVGSSIVGVCQVAYFDQHAEISVAVTSEHRQQGIGHALVSRGVNWCKTHGIQDLMMFCMEGNNIIEKIIKNHNLLPLMISMPSEVKFKVPRANASDYQQEIYSNILSSWMLLFKRLNFYSLL